MSAIRSTPAAQASTAPENSEPEITETYVGTVTHRLIALVAEQFGGRATPSEFLQLATTVNPRGSIVGRQALRMNAVTLAASYFRDFAFDSADFVGSEIWVGPQPVDLVWNRHQKIWVDEIKTGLTPAGSAYAGLELQVKEQWAAGAAEFGRRWGGVRAIILEKPESSFHLDSSGRKLAGVPR